VIAGEISVVLSHREPLWFEHCAQRRDAESAEFFMSGHVSAATERAGMRGTGEQADDVRWRQ
jgi:hypothetical protein